MFYDRLEEEIRDSIVGGSFGCLPSSMDGWLCAKTGCPNGHFGHSNRLCGSGASSYEPSTQSTDNVASG